MIKSSFTVVIEEFSSPTYISGVTSIVPNLNGFLFFTEDGENYQIEAHELEEGGIGNIAFEYFSDEVLDNLKAKWCSFYDHRKK